VKTALAEDIGAGDATTQAVGIAGTRGKAVIIAKEDGVLFGQDVVREMFRQLDPKVRIRWNAEDGEAFGSGSEVAVIRTDQAVLLSGERTALNFLCHLSGIATMTNSFVRRIHGTPAQILDTRKTLPGWRHLHKAAVKAGGGVNHRIGLFDAIMIKNNHVTACGGIDEALRRVFEKRDKTKRKLPVICEARTLLEVRTVLRYNVDWILLDNFGPAILRRIVREVRKYEKIHRCRVTLEASGGVTLQTVRSRAEAGVDFISIGALTHSAPAVDMSLRLVPKV